MLLTPDGGVSVIRVPRADLLLGVHPEAVRRESVAVLERGSTVLLYTDGLVERRDQVFDDGIELLCAALGELREQPVEQMCDQLLGRLLPDRAEDDVALVAVRLHPQERVPPTR